MSVASPGDETRFRADSSEDAPSSALLRDEGDEAAHKLLHKSHPEAANDAQRDSGVHPDSSSRGEGPPHEGPDEGAAAASSLPADESNLPLLDSTVSPYSTPMVTAIGTPNISRKERLRQFLTGIKFSLYVSHALSAWGDRMWTFGIGLFLADLLPGSLRLIAAYGFSKSGAVMLLGAVLGDWVDRRPRLFVARTSLVVQNLSVVVCGAFLALIYSSREELYDSAEWKQRLWEAVIIMTAVVSVLASLAMKLAVEKDWVSAMCEGDSAGLADMNATLRAIDQVIFILAPVATGLIMTVASMLSGALFIIAWNVVSVFAEFALLYRVYKMVPELSSKKAKKETEKGDDAELADPLVGDETVKERLKQKKNKGDDVATCSSAEGGCRTLCMKMFSPFITLRRGWGAYMSSDVKYAGLGLAFIYLTVLGFDNVFTGFLYSQGISQLYISIALGIGALCAISATVAYPHLRNRVGVETTGLIGFTAEVAVLSFCVASIWLPGSPFNLTGEVTPLTTNLPSLGEPWLSTSVHTENVSHIATTVGTTFASSSNVTTAEAHIGNGPTSASMISAAFLLTGAILARFGVWTADLAVNQLLLERVDKSQRGVINGVQNALNTFMSMFEFIMVIVAPSPHTFGALIMVSFLSVAAGALFHAIYCRKVKGYILCK